MKKYVMENNFKFSNIKQIIDKLEELQKKYNSDRNKMKTTGKWSVFQILNHLADSLDWAMKKAPLPDEKLIDIHKKKPELGPKLFLRMQKTGKMASGFQNPYAPDTYQESDATAEFVRLISLLNEFESYEGEYPVHLAFGQIDSEQWKTWCLFHCAHHLGYISESVNP